MMILQAIGIRLTEMLRAGAVIAVALCAASASAGPPSATKPPPPPAKSGGGSASTPNGPSAPTSGASEVPLATQLKFFDFDERALGNFEDLPMHWTLLSGPGLPAFCRGRFDDNIGRTAPPSFRVSIQGVGANAVFEYAHDDLLIEPDADYLVTGFVRCEGLRYSRAFLAAYLVDRFGERIAGSERISNLAASTTDATPPWQKLMLPVSAEFPGAFALRIQIWVLQSAAWRVADADDADPIRREDVRASAWFDDIRAVRVPRARFKLSNTSGLVRAGTPASLEFEVNGVGEQAFEVQFNVTDENGKTVHAKRHTLSRSAAMPLRIAVPAMPPGRYEAAARLFVGDELVLERTVALASVVELPPRPGGGSDIGVDVGAWTVGDAGGLQTLLGELRCREIKLHLNILEQIDTIDTIQHLRRLGDLMRTLAGARIDTVGVIRPPLSVLHSERPLSMLGYIESSTRWRELLGPLLAQMGGNVAAWQAGEEEAELAGGASWSDADLQRLREQVRRFVSIPEMVVPASALEDSPPRHDAIQSVLVSAKVPARELPRHLEFLVSASRPDRVWLRMDPPTGRNYSRAQRLAEYARRLTIARALEPERIFVPAPFELRESGGVAAWAPDELYVPLRTLMHYLNGSRATGVLHPTPDVVAVVFRNDEETQRGFAVMWTWRGGGDVPVSIYLGRGVRQIELYGRGTDLPQHDGLTDIHVPTTPVILDNVDVALALMQSSFSLTPDYFETHERRTKPTLKFKNHYNNPVNGSIEVRAPANWALTPRSVEFSLGPGQELEKSLDLVVPPRQAASTQKLDVTINMRGPQATSLKFAPSVTIGLRDVVVEVVAQWKDDTLFVDQSLRNMSSTVVNFSSFCDAPGRARQESQFLEVPPGETRARRYTFPAARDLAGKRLRAGVQEVNGRRSLDQLVDIPN